MGDPIRQRGKYRADADHVGALHFHGNSRRPLAPTTAGPQRCAERHHRHRHGGQRDASGRMAVGSGLTLKTRARP